MHSIYDQPFFPPKILHPRALDPEGTPPLGAYGQISQSVPPRCRRCSRLNRGNDGEKPRRLDPEEEKQIWNTSPSVILPLFIKLFQGKHCRASGPTTGFTRSGALDAPAYRKKPNLASSPEKGGISCLATKQERDSVLPEIHPPIPSHPIVVLQFPRPRLVLVVVIKFA